MAAVCRQSQTMRDGSVWKCAYDKGIGREYWWNTETRMSQWELPEE